jgi:hypothetical protein
MGFGSYSSFNAGVTRAALKTYTSSNEQIFKNRVIDVEMTPKSATLRESRDSAEHPNSLAVILGLDHTGSMGSIPQMMVRDGLPNIMSKIIAGGEKDPQVLFLAIGDHEYDSAPLQVGQFESNDELLDKWLLATYLEGGGGGNRGESYPLAWYFAANHTSIDCFEKRGRKGLLITIGDEPPLKSYPASVLKGIMETGQFTDTTAAELLEAAQATYDVYHIHLLSTNAGRRFKAEGRWQELLGDNLIQAQTAEDVAETIVTIVGDHATTKTAIGGGSSSEPVKDKEPTVVL